VQDPLDVLARLVAPVEREQAVDAILRIDVVSLTDASLWRRSSTASASS